jgi:hypothetical protein
MFRGMELISCLSSTPTRCLVPGFDGVWFSPEMHSESLLLPHGRQRPNLRSLEFYSVWTEQKGMRQWEHNSGGRTSRSGTFSMSQYVFSPSAIPSFFPITFQ